MDFFFGDIFLKFLITFLLHMYDTFRRKLVLITLGSHRGDNNGACFSLVCKWCMPKVPRG